VYTSSSSCYGDLLPPFSEAAAMRPGTPYARSKLVGERRVLGSGLQYVILRLFNVYGPGDQPGRWRNAIPNMSVTLERTGRMLLFGAEATRDFTFIDDCIDVLLQAERAAGQIVNVGTGRETHMCDLADRIRRLMGLPSAPIDVRASRAWTGSRGGAPKCRDCATDSASSRTLLWKQASGGPWHGCIRRDSSRGRRNEVAAADPRCRAHCDDVELLAGGLLARACREMHSSRSWCSVTTGRCFPRRGSPRPGRDARQCRGPRRLGRAGRRPD